MILKILLNHKVTVKEYVGNGAYGPIFSPPYVADCYFEKRNELVRDHMGQEVVSRGRFYTFPDRQPPVKSLVTIEGEEYEVVVSARFNLPLKGGKPHHTEVILK